MPTVPDLQNRMRFLHSLNVLQNSWNLQKLLESPPETCMWNLRQFGEVTIFDGKMPTAPDLKNRMKFRHFLNVLKNSWNLQNSLESTPETCMWNLRQFGEVTIFDRKMPTAPTLQNRMKFWHFLNVLKNSWNLQNLLESPPETCKWNLRQFGEVTIFDGKMPTVPPLQNRMKIRHFLNVLKNSWNLENLLESPPETCMWNLRQFGEVTIFDGKMPTASDLQSRMKFWQFLNVLKNSWNLQFIGITTRNMHVKFEAVRRSYNFWRKNAYSAEPSKQNEILTFTQFSPKFMKLTEFIGITTRNMHVKFEAVRRSYNFWRKNAYSAGPSKQDEILTFSPSSPKFMKFTEFIEIITRNMHVKFEAVWRSYNFWRKNAYNANLQNRMKFWHFLNVLQNSWNLQKLLESPPETCMWNLRQFREVTIFDEKMPTASTLQNRMKFWHFLNVLKNSWNLQNLLESPPETCMWNLRLFGEVTIFDRKMPTASTLQNRMKFWHFLNVLKNSWNLQNLLESPPETCMWNLRLFGEVTIFDGKMPTAPDLQNRMKFWHFLNVLKNSWNSQNLLESPPETCMWNLRQFGEVTIFDGKMPTAPDLQNRMKIRHFLNVLKNSWISQNLLESPPETCMWNLRQFGEVTIFDGKMPTAPDLQNRMKFWHFLNVLKNSWNLQNLLESPPETCMWNLRQFGEVTIFDGKMPTVPDLQNRMKIRHFLNVLKNSWNLENLLESPPETCMWNLRQFGEVTIFDGKMPTTPTFKTGWNFDIFSMFSKIHETYRSYWNHHQKHACEIWGSSEKLQFLTKKCLQRRPFKTGWSFDIFSMFSKIHEIYRIYWNHHQKHACEIWGCSEKLQFLTEKCLQRRPFKTGWSFDIFSMFSKIHEIYRIYWNHHQKHACEIWGCSEKLQFLTEKCLQRRTFKTGWSFDIFSMFSKIHEIHRIYWNHHQKHACEIWGSSEKLQFLTEKCLQRLTFKTGWSFDIFSMFSKIHEIYRIYWNHHQKHACEIWGSLEMLQFLREKCRQHRTFKTGWNFDIHSMFSKIHENYRSYWNPNQKHACEILGSLEKLQFLIEKCRQHLTFKTGWNFDIFPMFSKTHETYIIYWNHHQKHACEIWGRLEKLQFLKKNAYSAGPSKQDEIFTFTQCSPKFMKLTEVIGITTRNMHVKFEAVRRSYNFWRKNAYSAGP